MLWSHLSFWHITFTHIQLIARTRTVWKVGKGRKVSYRRVKRSGYNLVYNELRLAQQLCDAVIWVAGAEFQVHKIILSNCSEYFRWVNDCSVIMGWEKFENKLTVDSWSWWAELYEHCICEEICKTWLVCTGLRIVYVCKSVHKSFKCLHQLNLKCQFWLSVYRCMVGVLICELLVKEKALFYETSSNQFAYMNSTQHPAFLCNLLLTLCLYLNEQIHIMGLVLKNKSYWWRVMLYEHVGGATPHF